MLDPTTTCSDWPEERSAPSDLSVVSNSEIHATSSPSRGVRAVCAQQSSMSTRVIMWRYGVACLWRRIVTQAARALLRRYQILTGGSADLNDFEKHSLCEKSFAGLPVSKRASERGSAVSVSWLASPGRSSIRSKPGALLVGCIGEVKLRVRKRCLQSKAK